MTKYTIDDLLYLMSRLRDPATGCPWDIKQDYLSITPSTIEEAYEVVDAIECKDYDHLREELGDLLFQVVFYAQFGREDERFDFHDVVHGITSKLLRRHPHVFPDGTLSSQRDPEAPLNDEQINANWEAIKREERGEKGSKKTLDDIPRSLPGLTRAIKLQKRASQAGFDWSSLPPVLDKLQEEIEELKDAVAAAEPSAIAQEFGDILFTCVNIARHLKVEPEQSLRSANHKFEQRFGFVEAELQRENMLFTEASEAELDRLWEAAKRKGL